MTQPTRVTFLQNLGFHVEGYPLVLGWERDEKPFRTYQIRLQTVNQFKCGPTQYARRYWFSYQGGDVCLFNILIKRLKLQGWRCCWSPSRNRVEFYK